MKEGNKMTENEAIALSKNMWKEIKALKISKRTFLLEHEEGEAWLEMHLTHDCPLCTYTKEKVGIRPYLGSNSELVCSFTCPLVLQTGKTCEELNYEMDYPKNLAFIEAIEGLKEVGI